MEKVPTNAHAVASGGAVVTPLSPHKSLPEAVSLTNTPGRVFSTDASTTEDIAVVSSVSSFSSPTASQMSEGGLSPVVVARSEVRVEKPVVKQDKQTERPEAQAHKATPGDKVGKAFALLPPKLQAEKAKKKKGLAAARPKYMRSPATSGVAQPPSVRVPSPSKHKIQLAVSRKGDKDAASTLSSSFKPLHGDFARPTSGLLSLRTTSPATTTTTTTSTASPTRLSPSKKEKTEAGEDNTDRTAKKRPSQPKQDRSDLGVAARSNPHLSALADLLDNKVFTEEDVLLELEAIRKRALLTTAPFNKHLLPILAWYLLRDKFGEDAATRYVDCLTCPPGTRRLDGAVNTTGHIASFLPRVNELRRERRETKERVRKSPTHYYAITPPSSPTEAGNLSAATTTTDGSGRLSRRRRRCTPAYDTLEDASDIPSTQTSSPRTPSCQSPASSPRDRLHLCTREQVVAERQLMKEEDRSVVDVLVDAGATRAQAKNVYTVVEASASHSALPEPSIFQPPPSSLPSPPPPTAVATESEKVVEALQGKKAIPEPLSVTEVTTRIEDTTTHAANQQKSDLLQELSSISPVSAVGMAVDGGLSVFYNDGVGGALPAADAELAHMVNAEGHKALANGSHPREKAKKKAPHGPQNEKSTTVAGGTPDLSDIPCMLDDCVSAQTDFHQCSPDASGADCPYSYQAEPATGKDIEDKLAPNVESNESKIGTKEAKLHTMAGQAPVRPSPLLYSAIDHADRATQQTSSTHDVSSGPYDNAAQSSLLRPAKETQAPRKRGEDDSADGDTDTANARTRLARLDLSASRTTTATNVGGYSVLPDTSVATQKPASSPTTPSEDKRVPEERQLVDGGSPNRKRRNTTTTYEVTHGSTRINSNYGSLLPGGSTIDNANAAGPDLSDAASAGADYSAFEFTAPSQLAPSSPFTSRDVASSAFSSSAPGTAGGEMSAAAFSMFEQDSSLPRRRSSQRSHTARTTTTNSTVTSATQDAAPYSGFFSTRGGSMNTTRRSGTPAFSILNNKISASTMDSKHDETASHRQKLSINGSAFAFGSMMEGSELQTTAQRASSARTSRSHVTQTRDSSSGFAFSEVLLSPSDAGSSIVKERIRPSRTSAPSIMGDLSQVHSRADTHYGSLMGHALSQVSAAQRRSRLVPRFSQTASTRSVSRSLSGHFLSTLTHRCSSSSSTATAESSDVSESYGSVMELQETRRRRSISPHSPFPDSTVKPDRGDSYGSMIHNVTQTTTQEDDHNSTSEVQSPGTSRAYSAFQSQNVKETSSCRVKDQNSLLRTANAHSSVCADGTGGYSALAMDGSRSRDGAASNGGYSALAMDGSRSRDGAASNGGYSALAMSGGTADKVYSVEFSAVGVNSGCGDDICATETVSGAVPLSNGGYSVLEDRSQFHANVSSDVAAKRESQLGGSLADSTVADAVNTALKASEEKCVNTAAHRTDQHEAAACVPGQSTGGYSVLMMPDSLLKSDVLSGHAASDLPVEGICNKSSGTRSCTESNSSPVEEVATGGSNFVAARSAELSVNLPSSARDYPSVHSAAKSASHTTIADNATHSFDIYACWDSSVDGSAVNPAELQAVLKRLERPVSGLRENKACTFGEDGCRCALGGQPMHRLFSSAKPAPKTTINDEASITSPIVKAAASKTSSVPVPVDEKPKDVAQVLSSPVPVEPLQQRDVNTLPLPQDTEDKKQNKKRHALPLRPSPRAEGTPLRIGTGFNKRDSPQSSPSNPSSNPGEVSKLCMSGTTPLPYRRANGSASHPASLLDADVHMSRVTIISDPRSSNDVSMHNLPDLSTQLDALENKNNDSSSLRQLRCNPQQQHRQNTSRLAERHCELPLMAPVSILHNSTAAAVPAVVYGASNRPSDARLTPTPASVGTPREAMRSTQRTSAAVVTATQHGASVVGGLSVLCGPHATAHAPAEASVTMKQEPDQGNADDVSLRMPHDMTNVLFNGRTRDNADVTTVVSSAATFRRVATHMGRQEESHVARERSPEVLAKHANLATILASSRLDGSIVIDGHTTIVDGRTPPSRSPDPSHIGGVSSTLHNRTEDSLSVERHIVSRPRHNRSLRSNSAVSPSSSSSTESSCSSSEFSSTDEDASSAAGRDDTTLQHQDGSTTIPEVSQEACSHIAVATPRRRVLMQPQPLPASPESPRQRELSQRHHTIFDVPGVPYVESPDISTHIDRNETQEKQKKHEEFVMRWAQRGLLWQRQEREAQLWEEYHARAQTGQARAGQARAGQALEYVVVGAAGFMHHPPPPVLNARMPGQIAPQPHRRPGPMPMHDRPPMRPQRPGL